MSHARPKEAIEVPVLSDLIRRMGVPLSPVVRANGFVVGSGLPGIDVATGRVENGAIEAPTEASIAALRHAQWAAGSSLAKVAKSTVHGSHAAQGRRINKVHARQLAEGPPPRTFVAVGSGPPDFDIEIECVALA